MNGPIRDFPFLPYRASSCWRGQERKGENRVSHTGARPTPTRCSPPLAAPTLPLCGLPFPPCTKLLMSLGQGEVAHRRSRPLCFWPPGEDEAPSPRLCDGWPGHTTPTLHPMPSHSPKQMRGMNPLCVATQSVDGHHKVRDGLRSWDPSLCATPLY